MVRGNGRRTEGDGRASGSSFAGVGVFRLALSVRFLEESIFCLAIADDRGNVSITSIISSAVSD